MSIYCPKRSKTQVVSSNSRKGQHIARQSGTSNLGAPVDQEAVGGDQDDGGHETSEQPAVQPPQVRGVNPQGVPTFQKVPSHKKIKKRNESSKVKKKRDKQLERALVVNEKTEERLYKLADKQHSKKLGKNLWE